MIWLRERSQLVGREHGSPRDLFSDCGNGLVSVRKDMRGNMFAISVNRSDGED
jgi:hypothetical protein